MKLFIKLKCDEKHPVIDKLEAMAYNRDEVCIINPNMQEDYATRVHRRRTSGLQSSSTIGGPGMTARTRDQGFIDWAIGYFNRHEEVEATEERCASIVSSSGEELEDYDFLFEFIEEPIEAQVDELKSDVKALLDGLECEFEIVVK